MLSNLLLHFISLFIISTWRQVLAFCTGLWICVFGATKHRSSAHSAAFTPTWRYFTQRGRSVCLVVSKSMYTRNSVREMTPPCSTPWKNKTFLQCSPSRLPWLFYCEIMTESISSYLPWIPHSGSFTARFICHKRFMSFLYDLLWLIVSHLQSSIRQLLFSCSWY